MTNVSPLEFCRQVYEKACETSTVTGYIHAGNLIVAVKKLQSTQTTNEAINRLLQQSKDENVASSTLLSSIASIFKMASAEKTSDQQTIQAVKELGTMLTRIDDVTLLGTKARAAMKVAATRFQQTHKLTDKPFLVYVTELYNSIIKLIRKFPYKIREPYLNALLDCQIKTAEAKDGKSVIHAVTKFQSDILAIADKHYHFGKPPERGIVSLVSRTVNSPRNPLYISLDFKDLINNKPIMKKLEKKDLHLATFIKMYAEITGLLDTITPN